MRNASIRHLYSPAIVFLSSVFAIALSLFLGAILIKLIGIDPVLSYKYFVYGALGSANGLAETVSKFVPIIFCALCCTVAFKSGFSNIGNEGQFSIGGLGAVIVGAYLPPLPPVIHIIVAICAGIAFGAIWSMLAGYLKLKFNASELLTTMMLNYVAVHFLGLLYESALKDPSGIINQTKVVLPSVRLPVLLQGTRLTVGLFVAIGAIFFVDYLMNRTPYGFSMKIRGAGDKVAVYSGVNKAKTLIMVFVISGGLAGLGGAVELLGAQHRMMAGFSAGYGIDGIGASIMGRNNVIGVTVSSFLFAILRVGAGAMQRGTGVPSPVLSIIQGIIIVMVIVSSYVADKIITSAKLGGVYND